MSDLHVPEGATWADLAPRLRRILRQTTDEAVVVATSGSSGAPKRVRLGGAALRASGEATAEVLGGHGRWLLALPTHHVAGLQVLARSVLAGSVPVALPPGRPFTAATFAAAVDELVGDGQGPRYASLVPTQLHRLVGDPVDETGTRAAATLDAVLLGGAAADPGLLVRARAAGVRVVTTYGMSETCGGCVYDGRPLPGVQVRLEEGHVHLAGPVLADGYVDAVDHLDVSRTSERFVEVDGTRWFRTDDRGEIGADGRLRILGRVDDVIISGGHKVEPREVEAALRTLPQVDDVAVVGLSDPEWGQVVGAVIVPAGHVRDVPEGSAAWRETLRRAVPTRALPDHALPRRVAVRHGIPLLPSGKPDLQRLRGWLDPAAGSGQE